MVLPTTHSCTHTLAYIHTHTHTHTYSHTHFHLHTTSSLAGGSRRRRYSSPAPSCHSLYLHQAHSTQDFCKGHCRGIDENTFVNLSCYWLNLVCSILQLTYTWYTSGICSCCPSGLSDDSRLLEDCFCRPSS